MSNILIIGRGNVGLATERSMPLLNADFHDPYKGFTVNNPNTYEYAIVCVDTLQSGPDDYKDLDSVIEYLNNYSGTVVIRSTISPDKALEINSKLSGPVIMFPEFMDHKDFKNGTDSSSRIVLGGSHGTTKDFFKTISNYGYDTNKEKFFVSIEEACIIKLSSNAALATKVILFNSIYKICQGYGVSYDEIRKAIGIDSRIGIGHTLVPSPDDGMLGFGGHCLPKDIKAIAKMDKLGLFEHIEKINHDLGR